MNRVAVDVAMTVVVVVEVTVGSAAFGPEPVGVAPEVGEPEAALEVGVPVGVRA